MTRYSVYLATVVVLSNLIGPTFEPVYAQTSVTCDASTSEDFLRFSGWKMYFMDPPSSTEEEDVDIVLTADGRLLITIDDGDRRGSRGLTITKSWECEVDRTESTIRDIKITDIYQWGSVYAQEKLFDQRQLVRVFYRDNGVNRYAIIGRPDNNREDDLEWLILTSELQIRTGLMDTAERPLQLLQR
jgi:hypothetical protein